MGGGEAVGLHTHTHKHMEKSQTKPHILCLHLKKQKTNPTHPDQYNQLCLAKLFLKYCVCAYLCVRRG